MPQTFQEEMKWFAKGYHQPKIRREISAATIDAVQAMTWDKPFDDLLQGSNICSSAAKLSLYICY